MPAEAISFSTISPPLSSEDEHYEALNAAVAEMPHGRWFLEEYARRHRAADTQLLLDTIGRLEHSLSASDSRETPPGIYAQLLDTAKVIAQARAQIEGSLGAFTSKSDSEYRAQMLAVLVADLECRISSMLQLAAHAVETSTHEVQEEGAELDIDRGAPSDEPLDIPPLTVEPVAPELPTENESFELELEPLRVEPLLAAEPYNEEFCSGGSQEESDVHFATAGGATTPIEAPVPLPPASIAEPAEERVASNDPFAPIKAMTDEERIALFT